MVSAYGHATYGLLGIREFGNYAPTKTLNNHVLRIKRREDQELAPLPPKRIFVLGLNRLLRRIHLLYTARAFSEDRTGQGSCI